ncbi:MAG: hypothetical protein LGB72_01995 [Sulfurovum sp.]|nr:hypothetical protein [Sulfurovum sp.]
MFSQQGLSLDQAPPISVVLRFFLSGALFGIFSGIFILFFGIKIFDTNSTEAIILTHTLTLGVMLSFMFAALFQMLPVIAGVKLTAPTVKASLVQFPLIFGVPILLFAFYTHKSIFFVIASLLLGVSILSIAFIMLKNLLKLPNHSTSSKGITIALVSLIILTILALYLTSTLSGFIQGSHYAQFKVAHYSFGLFGWVIVLIISISFQVIEMFYVTPSYPKVISQYLPLTLLVILITTIIAVTFMPNSWLFSHLMIALLLTLYALLTLKRLTQKKRPLVDATVWFWRLGLTILIVSMSIMLITPFWDIAPLRSLSYIFFSGFSLSIVFAMFYKIVPFLTWFHLNSQGYFTAPMMHEVIHPQTAMKHLYIHIGVLLTFVLSVFAAPLIYIAGILTLLSFGWMLWQIVYAWKLYLYIQRTGKKFNMNIRGE